MQNPHNLYLVYDPATRTAMVAAGEPPCCHRCGEVAALELWEDGWECPTADLAGCFLRLREQQRIAGVREKSCGNGRPGC